MSRGRVCFWLSVCLIMSGTTLDQTLNNICNGGNGKCRILLILTSSHETKESFCCKYKEAVSAVRPLRSCGLKTERFAMWWSEIVLARSQRMMHFGTLHLSSSPESVFLVCVFHWSSFSFAISSSCWINIWTVWTCCWDLHNSLEQNQGEKLYDLITAQENPRQRSEEQRKAKSLKLSEAIYRPPAWLNCTTKRQLVFMSWLQLRGAAIPCASVLVLCSVCLGIVQNFKISGIFPIIDNWTELQCCTLCCSLQCSTYCGSLWRMKGKLGKTTSQNLFLKAFILNFESKFTNIVNI